MSGPALLHRDGPHKPPDCLGLALGLHATEFAVADLECTRSLALLLLKLRRGILERGAAVDRVG
jgi:hypothetical protein